MVETTTRIAIGPEGGKVRGAVIVRKFASALGRTIVLSVRRPSEETAHAVELTPDQAFEISRAILGAARWAIGAQGRVPARPSQEST